MFNRKTILDKFLDYEVHNTRLNLGTPSAAVLVPFFEKNGEINLLLTRRSDKLNKHPGQISFPGGKIDNGETVKEAAVRETFEEIGISSDDIELIGIFDDFATPWYSSVTPVLSIINPINAYVKSKDELDKILKVPLTDLQIENIHYVKNIEWEGQFFDVHHYDWVDKKTGDKHLIWGATAGVIYKLVNTLSFIPEGAQQ